MPATTWIRRWPDLPVDRNAKRSAGDRPGPHREDVAQDTPHARSRSLKGFNGRGVLWLSILKTTMAVAQVDHTGIFAGTHQNPGPFRGKPLNRGRECGSSNAPTTSPRTCPTRHGWVHVPTAGDLSQSVGLRPSCFKAALTSYAERHPGRQKLFPVLPTAGSDPGISSR